MRKGKEREGETSGCHAGKRMEGRARDQESQENRRREGRRDGRTRISAPWLQGLGVTLTLYSQHTHTHTHTQPTPVVTLFRTELRAAFRESSHGAYYQFFASR